MSNPAPLWLAPTWVTTQLQNSWPVRSRSRPHSMHSAPGSTGDRRTAQAWPLGRPEPTSNHWRRGCCSGCQVPDSSHTCNPRNQSLLPVEHPEFTQHWIAVFARGTPAAQLLRTSVLKLRICAFILATDHTGRGTHPHTHTHTCRPPGCVVWLRAGHCTCTCMKSAMVSAHRSAACARKCLSIHLSGSAFDSHTAALSRHRP